MAHRDLQAYLAYLEANNLLHRVKVEVDPIFEIAAISDRVIKRGGPALLFERVKGSTLPVATNLFGSTELVKAALEVPELEEPARRLRALLDLPADPGGWLDKLRLLPRLAELGRYLPRRVKEAPCQEVRVEPPSLEELPVLQLWPGDGGRFLTLPLVFTHDPATGRRNAGMYRMQVFDAVTTGMHWHIHKDGAEHLRRSKGRLEVAVALGADPAVIYAATAPLPAGLDEMLLAGFLRREPVEMVPALTVDIAVPARAEIILEGYVDPGETRREGPFGDHTGYYSPADNYPVFHLTCLTRRRQAVYPATVVGPPPMEDAYLGKVTERLFLPLIQLQLPEVVDINFPPAGVFHNCVIVAIRKAYPGQARKVMHALWGMGQMMFTKLIIIVDADVDVHDPQEVSWRVLGNIDPRRDAVIIDGPVDILDHAAPHTGFGSKMGLDATRKLPEEGASRPWPEEARASREVLELIDRRWQEYGLA
ncbi:menaquinone biosynthesis decarboxylase [Moorella sp. Hama-1]|uniref:menaquinone biosynthesis decarboxylase n=1 Tax=Moorella sp. Hama-1 TaxID=2138101 RepID=UPI000D64AA3B|nr:menaquinone biosynthesis decarboxylase [Moorella sp. Hama-1]MDN5361133.1 4-hydroxy-3-polyprenylbenzoate decarboxylase [Moorella sp. (in: firmicutes)]BCV20043.1 menaquinone biosynthesis decarboxylase [Moorella sp. Hama-1]